MSEHLYALARLVVMMATLTAVLMMTANNFDSTEIKAIIAMFVAAASVEGISAAVKKVRE